MTRVITIANEKGGVAKTTTAISMGGAIAQTGQSVLLVDLDPQASLTVYLGTNPQSIRNSTAELLMHSTQPEYLQTEIPNLDLIPAKGDLILAERFLAVRKDSNQIIKTALSKIRGYDTILIDTPPSLGVITHNALVAADLLIIPVVPEYLAVTALRDITQMLSKIRAKDNPRLSYRILFTMVDQRIKSHLTICNRFREKFGDAIFKTEIHIDTRLRDASSAGLPITHYLPTTRSAGEYHNLVKELSQTLIQQHTSIF